LYNDLPTLTPDKISSPLRDQLPDGAIAVGKQSNEVARDLTCVDEWKKTRELGNS
jgi:hypothetical protein